MISLVFGHPQQLNMVYFALDDHEGIAAHRTHHERRAFLLAEGAPPPLAGLTASAVQGVQADRSNCCAAGLPEGVDDCPRRVFG